VTPGHTHTDGRITFGCPGCIALAEQARIDNAPLRRCVWHCRYLAPTDDGITDSVVRTLTFARKVRVPDGWTGDQLDDHYVSETSEAFVMALPDDVRMEHTDWACETMEVTKVVIGELVLDAPAVTMVQESLL
jgi:hypothetical protein